jgi:hypothetical protein
MKRLYTPTEKSPWWLARAIYIRYGAHVLQYTALRLSTHHFIQRTMTTFELEYIPRLKSRPGGWLEQFVCDTVLTYSMYAALRFPAHHSIQRTMTTFELEYILKRCKFRILSTWHCLILQLTDG